MSRPMVFTAFAALTLAGCMSGAGIDFGNDKSRWAKDGECDDPRFTGPGTDEILLEEDRGRDATDCRALFQQGRVTIR